MLPSSLLSGGVTIVGVCALEFLLAIVWESGPEKIVNPGYMCRMSAHFSMLSALYSIERESASYVCSNTI